MITPALLSIFVLVFLASILALGTGLERLVSAPGMPGDERRAGQTVADPEVPAPPGITDDGQA